MSAEKGLYAKSHKSADYIKGSMQGSHVPADNRLYVKSHNSVDYIKGSTQGIMVQQTRVSTQRVTSQHTTLKALRRELCVCRKRSLRKESQVSRLYRKGSRQGVMVQQTRFSTQRVTNQQTTVKALRRETWFSRQGSLYTQSHKLADYSKGSTHGESCVSRKGSLRKESQVSRLQ